jgi:hypothetical protein
MPDTANGVFHGFVRDHRNDSITTFDAPAAGAGGSESISKKAPGYRAA